MDSRHNSNAEDIVSQALTTAGRQTVVTKGGAYSIDLLPASDAAGLLAILVKLLAPSIASAVDSGQGMEYVLPEDSTMFSTIAILFVRSLDDIRVAELTKDLMQNVRKDGVTIDADEEFKGRLGDYAKVVEFILSQNCGDFFGSYLQEKGLDLRLLKDMVTRKETSEPEQAES